MSSRPSDAAQRHNPRECWCGIDHSREQDPTQRVEATTTPEGEKGWETVQSRRTDTARGHGVDVAPDSQPEGVRVETRRTNDGDRGEPSNAPTAAFDGRFERLRSWAMDEAHVVHSVRHQLNDIAAKEVEPEYAHNRARRIGWAVDALKSASDAIYALTPMPEEDVDPDA